MRVEPSRAAHRSPASFLRTAAVAPFRSVHPLRLVGAGIAFHGGALLSRDLLRRQAAAHNDEEDLEDFESRLLPRATKPQILARMLLNLKRLYVHMHSFPQARDVTELLIAVDPSAINELRDRGLLAYHLKDFAAALRDLETYLRLAASSESTDEDHKDHAQIWEHVKTLRRRMATLN